MRSYKQVKADIAKLEREAQAARKSESAVVIAKIRDMAREYDLTAADLGLDTPPQARQSTEAPSKSAARKTPSKKTVSSKSSRSGAGIAKYRDPKSGRTWTGFGRAPDWLAGVKSRDAFRIDAGAAQAGEGPPASEAAQATPSDGRRGAPKAARKASAKAAAKKAAKKAVPGRPGSPARPAAAKQPAVGKGAPARNGVAVKKSGRKPARKAMTSSVARDQATTAASAGTDHTGADVGSAS